MGNKLVSLAQLNIVPVAVSYEYESCDLLKAREMAQSAHKPYVKQPGEDINSIITGISQPKGRVHFRVTKPIGAAQLEPLAHLPLNDAVRQVAQMIDHAIIDAYQLMPTNMAAYAMLHPEEPQNAQWDEAKAWLSQRLQQLTTDEERRHLLHIYANPVAAKQQIKQS